MLALGKVEKIGFFPVAYYMRVPARVVGKGVFCHLCKGYFAVNFDRAVNGYTVISVLHRAQGDFVKPRFRYFKLPGNTVSARRPGRTAD